MIDSNGTRYLAFTDRDKSTKMSRATSYAWWQRGHVISLGCSAGGWTSTTLAIAAEEEWWDEHLGHNPTLPSTNLDVPYSA